MKYVNALWLIALLNGCGGEGANIGGSTLPDTTKAVRALPFEIDTVMLSDLFQNGLKVGNVNVRVNGGTPEEWIATSFAVAVRVADMGADSVEVTVDRNDVSGLDVMPVYKHLAKLYYSANPNKSVWAGQEQFLAMVNQHPVTIEEMRRDAEYFSLVDQFVKQGMDVNQADRKSGEIISKKFHLAPDWKPAENHLVKKEFGEKFNITSDAAQKSLDLLDACMKGKIFRSLTPCG